MQERRGGRSWARLARRGSAERPGAAFDKAARLLCPGGWLALAGGEETYDEPVGSALEAMWLARSDSDGAWVTRPGDATAISA